MVGRGVFQLERFSTVITTERKCSQLLPTTTSTTYKCIRNNSNMYLIITRQRGRLVRLVVTVCNLQVLVLPSHIILHRMKTTILLLLLLGLGLNTVWLGPLQCKQAITVHTQYLYLKQYQKSSLDFLRVFCRNYTFQSQSFLNQRIFQCN